MVVLIIIVAAIAIGLASAVLYAQQRSRDGLHRSDEADARVVETATARDKRHESLDIRPLDIRPLDEERIIDYRDGWEVAQVRFADAPVDALEEADALVEAMMSERGYPVGDYDMALDDLSVEQADVLQHYRVAHAITTEIRSGDTNIEQMRLAMMHYRALFTELLDDSAGGDDDRDNGARPTSSAR